MGQGQVSQEVANRTATGITTLTAEILLRLFHAKPDSNLFFSAFSLSTALTMTAGGAKGQNLEEMLTALQFSQYSIKPEEVLAAFEQILLKFEGLRGNDLVTLTTANHLWIEKNFPLNPTFVEITKRSFHAGAEACDFVHNPDQERIKINSWASKETHGKINNLLPAGSIKADTSLVLTNAIYFKAHWVRSFNPERTAPRKFTLLSGQEIEVPTMFEKATLLFTQQEDFKAIEKPYKAPDGRTLGMVFILPEEPGIAGIEKALKAIKPHRPNSPPFFMTQMFDTDLTAQIPKFKIEYEFEASNMFRDLGMNQAFSGGDFSGISSQPLAITGIHHKAFVEVNEEGTEAAAATAVIMTRSLAIKVHTFTADRPFIFLIWDRNSRLIFFSGLVTHPTF